MKTTRGRNQIKQATAAIVALLLVATPGLAEAPIVEPTPTARTHDSF